MDIKTVLAFETIKLKIKKEMEKKFGLKSEMNIIQKTGFTLAEADCEQRLKLAGSGRDPKQASVTPFNASNQEKRKAFTLAETLIVIAIIGIIASIVTPMLFGTTSDAELKAAWKKQYSDLSQATMMIVADNGGTLAGAFPGDALGSEDLKNAFAAKLNIIKDCSGTSEFGGTGSGGSAEGCWHTSSNWQYLSGTTIGTQHDPGLILNNGILIRFGIQNSTCNLDTSYAGGDYTKCGYIQIDVNGFKKPNKLGKDIFDITIVSNALIPTGARGFYDPLETCIEGSTESTNRGNGCSAKYLYE
ncbi:MAG: prepilin-type N-terminal cleavage/methylation domain-containing protein [Candidatus Gastranaerophilales bacterium]|nr:prepilin-type N-terminal cleavage/methylation domain-containing protein [Candidatus Gastranaerophilales bacterium]